MPDYGRQNHQLLKQLAAHMEQMTSYMSVIVTVLQMEAHQLSEQTQDLQSLKETLDNTVTQLSDIKTDLDYTLQQENEKNTALQAVLDKQQDTITALQKEGTDKGELISQLQTQLDELRKGFNFKPLLGTATAIQSALTTMDEELQKPPPPPPPPPPPLEGTRSPGKTESANLSGITSARSNKDSASEEDPKKTKTS